MSTYPNATPPPGALFDNALAAAAEKYAATFDVSVEHARMLIEGTTLQPAHLSCNYTDGVTAIWANGRTQRGRCRSDKVMTAEQARAALASGMACVFVLAGDAEAVRGAVGVMAGDGGPQ